MISDYQDIRMASGARGLPYIDLGWLQRAVSGLGRCNRLQCAARGNFVGGSNLQNGGGRV